MAQPIPKKIINKNPELLNKKFYTLLVDGNNLLRISQRDATLSSDGKNYGAIFQFLLQIKIMLQKGNFSHVYVMWDGDNSGALRYSLYTDYKMNRDGKTYKDTELSDYMKRVNANIAGMTKWAKNKQNPNNLAEKQKDDELFFWQRDVIMECLEELFVRQVICDDVEGDDLIAQYVKTKKSHDYVVIVSADRDLSQLISETVCMWFPDKKKFITDKNHKEEMGFDYRNIVLKKIICGDASDNIKGIKSVGEKTLLTNFPQIVDREVTLEEVIEGAKKINEDRVQEKKKPLKWAENIVNSVTDGIQGDKIYEINEKIINLKNPMLTKEAIETLEAIMYAPMSKDDRTMDNLYNILRKNSVETILDANRFSSFFNEFMTIIDREKKFNGY